jgi:hypothetical protein
MKLIPMIEINIKYVFMSLKSKHSTGYDGISSRILKCCINEIRVSVPLTYMIIVFLKQYLSQKIEINFNMTHL